MKNFTNVVFAPDLDLNGVKLLKASAGTGKTYNIQNVFLRLVVSNGLNVQNILALTFTEAATHELRARLRAILVQCRDFLKLRLAGKSIPAALDDTDAIRLEKICGLPLMGINSEQGDKERLARVLLAVMNFDNAPIFTIHGFCNRILTRYAFECGHEPDAQLLTEPTNIIRKTCLDWWRQNTYADENFSNNMPFADPREFQDLVNVVFKRPDARTTPAPDQETLQTRIKAFDDAVEDLKQKMQSHNATVKPRSKNPVSELEDMLAGQNGHPPQPAWLLKKIQELSKTNILTKKILLQTIKVCAPIEGLINECKKLAPQLGNARKADWQGNLLVFKTGSCDLTNLLKLIVTRPDALHEACSRVPWKTSQDIKESCERLCALTPGQADASKTLSDIKKLAKFDSGQHCIPELFSVADLSGNLINAVDELRRHICGLRALKVAEAAQQVHDDIRSSSALTYTAMLLEVRNALQSGAYSERLRQVLLQEFHAVMVDEFQDTDPVQYEIFRILFLESSTRIPLLFVGDPKQAIFGFRGGDIFTYYNAEQTIPSQARYELNTNFRAETKLVQAINEFFADLDECNTEGVLKHTFKNPNITYRGDLKANGIPEHRRLTSNAIPDLFPLRLLFYKPDEDQQKKTSSDDNIEPGNIPARTSPTSLKIYHDTASEIADLLSDTTLQIGGRHVLPHDIAVLVLDHDEATRIHNELLSRGINAVRQATGCVLDADEAFDLARIMQAMLEPKNPKAARSALCGRILPCTCEDIKKFNEEPASLPNQKSTDTLGGHATNDEAPSPTPDSLEQWMALFAEAGTRWTKRSFIEAFRFLADRLGLRAHIIGFPDGARRLSDLLHLVEWLHQSARERKYGPHALASWFVRQLDSETRTETENDSTRTRLASDEPAVQIMTVFKSKGLEFPIVFAPTLWRLFAGSPHSNRCPWQLHDDAGGMTLNFDPCDYEARKKAESEIFEEHIRLVYVALTRAVNRVYVVAFDNPESREDSYALDHLLSAWISRRQNNATNSLILTSEPPDEQPEHHTTQPSDLKPAHLIEPLTPKVNKAHGHTSYSALVTQHKSLPFREQELEASSKEHDLVATESEQPDQAEDHSMPAIFTIPGDAKTGHCMHWIFENIDFQAHPDATEKIINDGLDCFKICTGATIEIIEKKRRAVTDMVFSALATPLDSGYGKFALRDISLQSRRSELDFKFSLKQSGAPISLKNIGAVLNEAWNSSARNDVFIDAMLKSNTILPLGFMAGSIDLLFEHQGRFYIVDWKTNKLNSRLENFRQPGLRAEMERHSYYLQYMIYTVAAHALLAQNLSGYDYEKHFGGIFYIFLRGLSATNSSFVTDVPPKALIEELARLVVQG